MAQVDRPTIDYGLAALGQIACVLSVLMVAALGLPACTVDLGRPLKLSLGSSPRGSIAVVLSLFAIPLTLGRMAVRGGGHRLAITLALVDALTGLGVAVAAAFAGFILEIPEFQARPGPATIVAMLAGTIYLCLASYRAWDMRGGPRDPSPLTTASADRVGLE